MRKTQDRIWFKKSRHSIEGRIEFIKEVKCLNSEQLPFIQELQIRERIKDEIFREIYGQMPRTAKTIQRHIKKVEEELRAKGETKLANKLASAAALVLSLEEQMEVARPESIEVVIGDD